MSNDDYSPMEETAYFLRNPNGAKPLLGALELVKSGEFEAHAFVELEDS